MDLINLKRIKQTLKTEEGRLLLEYLSDYVTEHACSKQREASEIKGMCELLQQIKLIPDEVKKLESKQ